MVRPVGLAIEVELMIYERIHNETIENNLHFIADEHTIHGM